MNFITIKESNNSANLVVLKSRLEAEGIQCKIEGDLSSQVLGHRPMVFARLKVLEEDMTRVRAIMIELNEWQEEKTTLNCPKCKSNNIKVLLSFKNIFRIAQTFFIAIFSFTSSPSMFEKSELICKNCGHRFIR